MSIAAAILALNPTVYWKLDDIGTAILADSSGNSHPALALINSALGAPGPESGTFALAGSAADAGAQIQGNTPLVGSGPFSMAVWFASSQLTSANHVLVYVGSSSSNGFGIITSGATVELIYGGLGVVNTGAVLSAGRWHQVGMSVSPGGTQSAYVDGVQVYTAAAGVPNAVVAGNPILAQTPDPGLLAHAAFWGSAISAADFTAMWAAGPGAVPAPPISGRASTDADVAALENKLDTILKAVRKIY